MASLYKQPKSRFWYARWRDAKGRLRRLSTRTTVKHKAQKIADAYQAVSAKEGTLRATRAAILKLHTELAN